MFTEHIMKVCARSNCSDEETNPVHSQGSSEPDEIPTDTVSILVFFFKRSYREQRDVQQKKMKYISRK